MLHENSVDPVDSIESKGISITNDHDSNESGRNTLEHEKESAMLMCSLRKSVFNDITNNDTLEIESLKHIFTGFTGILMSLLLTSVYTLIPWSNIMINPEKFYEAPIMYCLSFELCLAAHWTIYFSCTTNINKNKSLRFFFKLWMILIFVSIIAYAFLNLVWVHGLSYQNPVPFNGYIIYLNSIIFILLTLWFNSPRKWRQNENFQQRYRRFVFGGIYSTQTLINYAVITGVLQNIPEDYQWVAAFFLPLVRELNSWIILKLFAGSADGDFDSTKLYLTIDIGVHHASFLSLTVGNTATVASTLVIIGVDFAINIFLCFRILYLKHKNETLESNEKIVELIQELVINEWIEVTVPIGYLLCLLLGYYGPNKDLIGDIGNSFWQFKALDDIEVTIMRLLIFAAVDLISLFVTGIILWRFCRISLYKGYVNLSREFGLSFATCFSMHLTGVSKKL